MNNLALNNKFIQKYVSELFNELIISTTIRDSLLYINIRKQYFLLLISIFKNHSLLNFDILYDIWGVDFPKKEKRFQLNYLLTCTFLGINLILRTFIMNLENQISLVNIYSSAGWLEREVWDMFGVNFTGNPDLRRILTDYGFEGFPLRKDFPLSGFYEIRYDLEYKRLTFDSIELTQEFRFFYFQKVWN